MFHLGMVKLPTAILSMCTAHHLGTTHLATAATDRVLSQAL